MFDLDRFAAAQEGVFNTALAELRAGHKRSHWMWFVFPQLAGLGHSEMARRYAIASLAEAIAYLAHPLLGSRLLDCLAALDSLPPTSAEAVFGGIDAVKLRSSLTLFSRAAAGTGTAAAFAAALQRWCQSVKDDATVRLLEAARQSG